MIYCDHAATSFPKPLVVADAMCLALQNVGNSGRGAHGLSLEASRLVFEARFELADFLGAEDPSCIAFTANATESLNLAILGLFKPGDHVITTVLEHNSVLRPLYELEKNGVDLTILPANSLGVLDLSALPQAMQPNTTALICTHASNVTGNVVDVDLLGRFCKEHGLFFIVDGAQTAGWYPYRLREQEIDILCFTGHKALQGPQGIGGIYLKPGVEVRPLKTGGSGIQTFSKKHPQQMPEALEAGTLNTPGIAGLLAGIHYVRTIGLDAIERSEDELTQSFYQGAKAISGVKIYGDFSSPRRAPVVSLNVRHLSASLVSEILAEDYGIFTRSGGHCAPLIHGALGTVEQGAVRFSFSHTNTMDEINQVLTALEIIGREYGGES